MLEFVQHRVGDSRIISMISRWLKAGVMENGVIQASEVDFIVGFQYLSDAHRFQEVLKKRLEKFALTLERKKTRLIEFGRFATKHAKEQGKRLETIYFLGFTHYCARHNPSSPVGIVSGSDPNTKRNDSDY